MPIVSRRRSKQIETNSQELLELAPLWKTRQRLPPCCRRDCGAMLGPRKLSFCHGLSRPVAEIRDDAFLAQRTARHARVAPVQNQPVMRVQPVLVGDHFAEPRLDLERIFPDRQSRAVAD